MLSPMQSDDKELRQPPHNFEAEQALLGAIFANNRALGRVSEFLTGAMFAEPLHGRIYQACQILSERGQLANPVTMKSYLASDLDLQKIGGDTYLMRLVGAAATIINAADYGKMIFDLHLRRALIALGEDIVNDAFAPEVDVQGIDQLEASVTKLNELASTAPQSQALRKPGDYLDEVIESAQDVYKGKTEGVGIKTGYASCDRKIGAMHPADLILLAGRPSMGKSALGLGIAINAAEAGTPVAFFTPEMLGKQVWQRAIAIKTGISVTAQMHGPLSDHDIRQIIEWGERLKRLPLYVDERSSVNVASMKAASRRFFGKDRLGLVVVDYLQQLDQDPGSTANGVTAREISLISKGLKGVAKDLKVPVLALSQLSRAVESREDKRPTLADLRDSGSLEQDADVVGFVYREEYYLERGKPKKAPKETESAFSARLSTWEQSLEESRNLAEVIWAKNRQGAIGTAKLLFEGTATRFSNLVAQASMDL